MPANEGSRERNAIPVQAQLRTLFEALETLTSKFLELQSSFDSNDEEIREVLASVSTTVQALRTIIYGNQDFRLTGIADRIQLIESGVHEITETRRREKIDERLTRIEAAVAELVEARQSQTDQLKGMKFALAIIGVGGGGTLVTVLLELFKP